MLRTYLSRGSQRFTGDFSKPRSRELCVRVNLGHLGEKGVSVTADGSLSDSQLRAR